MPIVVLARAMPMVRTKSFSVRKRVPLQNCRLAIETLRTTPASGVGDDSELLGDGRIWIEGIPRLSFSHHVDHLAAGRSRCSLNQNSTVSPTLSIAR